MLIGPTSDAGDEQGLRASEERYRTLFESIPLPILVYDAQTLRILRVNEAALGHYGFSREEFAGLTTEALHPPEDLPAYLEWIRHKAPAGVADAGVWRHRKKDGTVSEVRVVAHPLVFDAQPARLAIMTDVTDTRRAEEALRLQAAALNAAANAILITDREGRLRWVNPAFTVLTGYTPEEALGQTPRVLKSGTTDPATYAELWAAILAGRVWHGELINRRKDGTLYDQELTVTPVRDARGEITHFVGVSHDVTERRRLEEQFRQAQKMEAVGQLTSGIAHDFNNILSIILGNAELVTAHLGGEQTELVGEVRDIEAAAGRGATMIKKLLGFSRQADLDLRPVDIREIAANALGMLRRLLPEDIEITVEVEESLGAVRADTGAVEQILVNLATNARDAMPHGGALRITAEPAIADDTYRAAHPWVQAGEYACLAVSDTGVGMDDETKARIFEPFFTTKPPGQGTGLGMAMIYGLMKQHGGFVHVYSERGKGTIIRLYFPLALKPAVVRGRASSAEQIAGGHETILLAEDEDALRRTGKRILERLGYRVLVAADGEEALELYRAHKDEIDLVLSDVVMPKLSGPDLWQAICQEGKNVRFLFSSGYGPRDLERLAVDGLAPGHLQKPWTLAEIARAVRAALGRVA